MPRADYMRRVGFVVAIFAATMLLFTISRIVFIMYNHSIAEALSMGEVSRALLHGLKLDATVAGYITALPLLASLASIWLAHLSNSVASRCLNLYFIAVSVVMAAVQCADIGMFEEWQRRIDSQIFIYTPREMLSSLSAVDFVAAALYIAAMSALAIWLYRTITGHLYATPPSKSLATRAMATLLMVTLAGLLFVCIRGGVTTATANVSKAYFSSNMFLNQTAVNPLFSLIDTSLSGDDFDQYDYYPEEHAEELYTQIMADSGAQGEAWLNTSQPNIVLILVEGMGRTITDADVKGRAVTPNICRLASEGIWFDRLYASSFRTDRGTVSTLSGFPSQPKMSVMKYPAKAANLSGIASTLRNAGYATRFFYGGDANFTNTRAYLYATGYDELLDESSLRLDGHRSKWGYADDVVLEYAAEAIIERMESGMKSFDTILTLSSHEPFEVPASILDDERLNAFAFTDRAIGEFVERLRATPHWENMLVIIVPDHGYPYPHTVSSHSAERHHIPMLWVGGAVAEPRCVAEYASQTDLAATLLAQMSLPHDDFPFSRNIASADASHFGYWTFNNGFSVADSEGITIYDCDSNEVLYSIGDNADSRIERGKAMLQTTFRHIKEL